MYTLVQKLNIVQLLYKSQSPAEISSLFNAHQGHKYMSKCAELTSMKIERIVQHFEREENFHRGRRDRRSNCIDTLN